jgi:hypothetical protein
VGSADIPCHERRRQALRPTISRSFLSSWADKRENRHRVSFDAKRTQVAQSAFDFSRYFASIFDSLRIGGAVARRPVLVAPEGMSTAGGKRARQSLVLQPDDPMAAAVTIGWVDIGERRAMVRTHGALAALHAERFRDRAFDVDPTSYSAFFEQVRSFLDSCGFAVKVEADGAPPSSELRNPPPGAPARRGATSASNALLYAVAAFFIGVLVGGFVVYARLVLMR